MCRKASYSRSGTFAAISTLPVIVACALLGATEARAATCTADPSGCQPYVATIQQVGPGIVATGAAVVATGSGEFDLTGLTPGDNISLAAGIFPQFAALNLASGNVTSYGNLGQISGPTNFRPGSSIGGSFAFSSSGPLVSKNNPSGTNIQTLLVPVGYTSGTILATSRSIYTGTNILGGGPPPATFATLGVTPGLYEWTWGPKLDQSFTICTAGDCPAAPTPPTPGEIPLPAAFPLFASGIGGLGLLGWRRKRRARARVA